MCFFLPNFLCWLLAFACPLIIVELENSRFKNKEKMSQILFLCSMSIYFPFNSFYQYLNIHSTLLCYDQLTISDCPKRPYLNFICLTYILHWMWTALFVHFSEAMGSAGFVGVEDEAVHGSSIQMDRRLPALPEDFVCSCVLPALRPHSFFCCKTRF